MQAVRAVPADQPIVAVVSEQHVIAGTAAYLVGTGAAAEKVGAITAIQDVVAVAAVELVVAGAAIEDVVSGAAAERVVPAVVELHGNGEGRGSAEAVRIGDLDHDAVLVGGLKIEQRTVGDHDRAAGRVDREAAAGIVDQGVRERVAGIRIRGRDHADDGAFGRVLDDGVRGELDDDWRLVGRDRRARRQLALVRLPHDRLDPLDAIEAQLAAVGEFDEAR